MKRRLLIFGGGGLAAALIAVSGYAAHSQTHHQPQQISSNDSWKSKWVPASDGAQHAGLKIQLDANGNHVVPPATPGRTNQAGSNRATLAGNKSVRQIDGVKLVVPAKGSEELRGVKGADGKAELVHLHGKFHSAMKATIGPDGKLQYDCNEAGAE